MIQFYLDTRGETPTTLAVESSMALIRDYLESLVERMRTVPTAGKHALTICAEAIGVD